MQLEDEPLARADEAAEARTVDGHLDVKDTASREYLAEVADEHESFEDRLAQAAPAAKVQWRYNVAFNGLALALPAAQLGAVRQLPGVVNITETYDVEPELARDPIADRPADAANNKVIVGNVYAYPR